MKTIVKYSLALGATLLGWDFLFYNYLWKSESALLALLPSVFLVGFYIFMAIKELKLKKFDGKITYKDASLNGLLVMIFAAFIYSTATYFTFPYGNSSFKDDYMTIAKEKVANDATMDDETKIRTVTSIETSFSASQMARSNFISVIIYGTIASLLSASIQRKKLDIPISE